MASFRQKNMSGESAIGPIDVEKTSGASVYGNVAFNRVKAAEGRSVSGNTGGLHRHMKNLQFMNIGESDVKRLLFDDKTAIGQPI